MKLLFVRAKFIHNLPAVLCVIAAVRLKPDKRVLLTGGVGVTLNLLPKD